MSVNKVPNKEQELFNFKLHKIFDVSAIQNHVLKYDNEWGINTNRQKMFPMHSATTSYHFVQTTNFRFGDVYKPRFTDTDPKMWSLIYPIINEFEINVNGKVGKTLFILLPKGKEVEPHADGGDYLDLIRRFHIPIITNPQVEFKISDETINMKVGECWEINNNRVHSVSNRGDSDRIHLLFDIMPNWVIESAGKIDTSKRETQITDPNHI